MDAQDRKEIMNVILFRQEYKKQLKEKLIKKRIIKTNNFLNGGNNNDKE